MGWTEGGRQAGGREEGRDGGREGGREAGRQGCIDGGGGAITKPDNQLVT